jgi:hypothetical protein
MNNPTDSAIESVENQTLTKRGPRDRFYFCAAVRGKNVVYEAVKANSSEEAKAIFEKNHDIKATVCDDGAGLRGGGNGFYVSMGTGQSEAQRVSVTVTPAQLACRTTQAYQAQFKGWHVWGSGLKACTVKVGSEEVQFDDNQLVSIEFGERVEPDKKVQKPKLKKKEVIRLEDLERVEAL